MNGFKASVLTFMAVAAVACSDTNYQNNIRDAGVDSGDVGSSENSSSGVCSGEQSDKVYLIVESSNRVDIDAISVNPCENNSEAFVCSVYESWVGDDDSVGDVVGFPDSTCEDGFVEIGNNDYEALRVEFCSVNIKLGDELVVYFKSCEGYSPDTSSMDLYLLDAIGNVIGLDIEATGPNTFIVRE